jgi:hypothetical protein
VPRLSWSRDKNTSEKAERFKDISLLHPHIEFRLQNCTCWTCTLTWVEMLENRCANPLPPSTFQIEIRFPDYAWCVDASWTDYSKKAQYSPGKSKVVRERSDSVTTKLFDWRSCGNCSGAGIRAPSCTRSPGGLPREYLPTVRAHAARGIPRAIVLPSAKQPTRRVSQRVGPGETAVVVRLRISSF